MQTLLPELAQQPAALLDLIAFYSSPEGDALLNALPDAGEILLTGMGASYHAAWIAAHRLVELGLRALALEAVDLVFYDRHLLRGRGPVVYLSQSGSSGEVEPLLDALAHSAPLVAVTNEPGSPLARGAQLVLPLHAGAEKLVASKSYTNSLAALWLVGQRWANLPRQHALDALARVADQMSAILDDRDAVTGRLLSEFGACEHLVFLGHGPHAATARQAAMAMSEWSKLPAHDFGIGAFRHGFIETVTPE